MQRTCFALILALAVSALTVDARTRRDTEGEVVAEAVSEAVSEATSTTTTEAPKIPCEGKTKVCVEPKLCNKGTIDGNTLTRNYNYVS